MINVGLGQRFVKFALGVPAFTRVFIFAILVCRPNPSIEDVRASCQRGCGFLVACLPSLTRRNGTQAYLEWRRFIRRRSLSKISHLLRPTRRFRRRRPASRVAVAAAIAAAALFFSAHSHASSPTQEGKTSLRHVTRVAGLESGEVWDSKDPKPKAPNATHASIVTSAAGRRTIRFQSTCRHHIGPQMYAPPRRERANSLHGVRPSC